jgi:hypothetical protein
MHRICLLWIFICLKFSLQAQTLLQDLPVLNDRSFSFMQSTYDRTGLNDDHITPEFHNYYNIIPEGLVNNPGGTATSRKEYVICSVNGPAVLERFWMIPFPFYFNTRIRFYFDGESAPRVNKTFNDIFFNQSPPFTKPLVQNMYESSGGFWSYMKMPVAKSLLVTIDTAAVFCQFGVRQLPRDTVVQSWTAGQDNSVLENEFGKSGTYPKDNAGTITTDSLTISLLPLQRVQVFSKTAGSVIEGIKMQLPDLDYTYASFIKDKGNFHKGTSRFTMKVNGNANTAYLIKRSNKFYHLDFNYDLLAENALVKVDNQPAGTWTNRGYRTYRYWKDDTFAISKSLFQGKSQLSLQLQYQSGEPWNEYYYWMICDNIITDSLDVTVASSETAHNYAISNLQGNLYTEISNRYDAPLQVKQRNHGILDSLYIKIYFDDETVPSIDAPAGLFFGTGSNDATYMRSLPCGNVNGEFYNFFSMPFWKNARMELDNRSHTLLNAVSLKTLTAPNGYSKSETGYLKAFHNKTTKNANDATDYRIAAISGRGKYVGTIMEADQNDETVFCWLEGDDRVYIDDSKTPFYYGTGTEDYFNSTFYFYLDEYSQPQNGMVNSDVHFHKSMYHFHLTDPVNFQKNIRFQIEHGDYNNKLGNYESLAYAYVGEPEYVLTDSLDPGNAASEVSHGYTSDAGVYIDRLSSFEGEQYQQTVEHDGYRISDSVRFRVNILPDNKEVRLLRTFSYLIQNQRAKVYVDDSLAGEWLNAGFNTATSFRDDYFIIPGKYTRNKSSLNIKIVNSETVPWTEFYYKVYTVLEPTVVSGIAVNKHSDEIALFPALTDGSVFFTASDPAVRYSAIVADACGKTVKAIREMSNSIDLSGLADGLYFISVSKENKFIQTGKVILQHR